MSTLSNLLSSAVEKLLFHPVTITHAETIDGHFRRVRLQGEVFKGLKWVPGQAVQFYLGNLTKRAYTPMEMGPDGGVGSVFVLFAWRRARIGVGREPKDGGWVQGDATEGLARFYEF